CWHNTLVSSPPKPGKVSLGRRIQNLLYWHGKFKGNTSHSPR
ncbi:unnamed protein product, partial [Allacma fusca]